MKADEMRSTAELVKEALSITDIDDDRLWDIVRYLQTNRIDESFESSLALCKSTTGREKTFGIWLLSQLGTTAKPYHEETLAIFTQLFRNDIDPTVLRELAIANTHRNYKELVPYILPLADHQDPAVRYGAIFGLAYQNDTLAITALIKLTNDDSTENRDWATFALGSQIDTDTPAIRDALYARTTDTDSVVRGEAFVGLARRHDDRVVDALIQELEYEKGKDLGVVQILEAADEINDPRLAASLVRLRDDTKWEPDDDYIRNDLDELIKKFEQEANEDSK